MNKAMMKSLGISQAEKDLLATVPHHWAEVEGGAVVFFLTPKDNTPMYLEHPEMGEETGAEFWAAVKRLPMVKEINSRYFTDNPVTAEEFAKWDWQDREG